jgi:hypothetical protein
MARLAAQLIVQRCPGPLPDRSACKLAFRLIERQPMADGAPAGRK